MFLTEKTPNSLSRQVHIIIIVIIIIISCWGCYYRMKYSNNISLERFFKKRKNFQKLYRFDENVATSEGDISNIYGLTYTCENYLLVVLGTRGSLQPHLRITCNRHTRILKLEKKTRIMKNYQTKKKSALGFWRTYSPRAARNPDFKLSFAVNNQQKK